MTMTKGERDGLAKLARQRARLAKQMVAERECALRADVEDQLSAQQRVDDEMWAEAVKVADAAVKAANAHIDAVCAQMGMPEEARPHLNMNWWGRGGTALGSRRAELRKLAEARIAAAVQSARTTIDTKCLAVETELLAPTMTSELAKTFLEAMPTADDLMPRVDLDALAGGERQPWTPPKGLAGAMLTPTSAAGRAEQQKALGSAFADMPGEVSVDRG